MRSNRLFGRGIFCGAALLTGLFAGLHLIRQTANHVAACVGEDEREETVDHDNDPGGDQGAAGFDSKDQVLDIAFIGIVQMFCEEGFAHKVDITQSAD